VTAIRSAIPPVKRAPRRGARGGRRRTQDDVVSLVLRKPTDEIAMLDLAAQLNGRPVPGLRMTEAEFVAWWDEDVNAEWVDGEVVLMPPVSLEQADLFGWLCSILRSFVEDRDLGKVLGPEFSIRLSKQRRWRVPDLLVVLKHRLHLLAPTCLEGAPDVAFEIVSPDSVVRDWRDKYQEYQAAGVREYWVIDPTTRRAEAYTLARRKYALLPEVDGRITSKVLDGFHLRPAWFWKSPLPRVGAVLRELGVGQR
jgi:Uma2 family endonuclease